MYKPCPIRNNFLITLRTPLQFSFSPFFIEKGYGKRKSDWAWLAVTARLCEQRLPAAHDKMTGGDKFITSLCLYNSEGFWGWPGIRWHSWQGFHLAEPATHCSKETIPDKMCLAQVKWKVYFYLFLFFLQLLTGKMKAETGPKQQKYISCINNWIISLICEVKQCALC